LDHAKVDKFDALGLLEGQFDLRDNLLSNAAPVHDSVDEGLLLTEHHVDVVEAAGGGVKHDHAQALVGLRAAVVPLVAHP